MTLQPIVSPEEWEAARQQLLVREKELATGATRWRRSAAGCHGGGDNEYRFEGPAGAVKLADLFEGRRQLIVYRAFYAPDVTTYPSTGGSTGAGVQRVLARRRPGRPSSPSQRTDTKLVFVSRAPQADIAGCRSARAGRTSPGTRSPTASTPTSASTKGTGPTPSSATANGSSDLLRADRGDEQMGDTWNYLDITALGRQEAWEDSPRGPADAAVPVVELPRRLRHDLTDEGARLSVRARQAGMSQLVVL